MQLHSCCPWSFVGYTLILVLGVNIKQCKHGRLFCASKEVRLGVEAENVYMFTSRQRHAGQIYSVNMASKSFEIMA